MGEINEYLCESCGQKFEKKVGRGKLISTPKLDPKECPFCKSNKIKFIRRTGIWD